MTTNCWTVFLEICLTDLFKYSFITSQQLIGQQVIYNNWNSRKHFFFFFLVGANTEVVFCHYPMAVSLWCCSQGTRGGLKWQFTFLCAQLHTDTHTPASSEAALGWSISRSVFILPLCWWCCVCVCASPEWSSGATRTATMKTVTGMKTAQTGSNIWPPFVLPPKPASFLVSARILKTSKAN